MIVNKPAASSTKSSVLLRHFLSIFGAHGLYHRQTQNETPIEIPTVQRWLSPRRNRIKMQWHGNGCVMTMASVAVSNLVNIVLLRNRTNSATGQTAQLGKSQTKHKTRLNDWAFIYYSKNARCTRASQWIEWWAAMLSCTYNALFQRFRKEY